jgi:dynein intermediate chain
MSDRRRAEIEAKRAKLAAIREARELRKQQEAERKSNNTTPGPGARGPEGNDEERQRVESLVNNLLGETSGTSSRRRDSQINTPSSLPSTPAPGTARLAGGLGLLNADIMNGFNTRSGSRTSDTGSESRHTMSNTMVQVGGDYAADR